MAASDLLPPLLPVDEQHHGAWVALAAALGLTITLACLLIRLYVRLSISPSFGTDDIVFLVATGCTIIQNGTIFGAISKGFGNAIELISAEDRGYILKSLFTADIFYLATLYLTKCCIISVFLRLTPVKAHKWLTWTILGFATAWAIASVFLISIDCELNASYGTVVAKCSGFFLRWQLITALDIIIEGCLFCLAIFVLLGLQMPLRKKLVVLSTFGSRLPLIVFVGIRLHAFYKGSRASDPSLGLVDAAVWTQVALHFSVIACTSLCLKPFMAAVSTNYGNAGGTSSGGYATEDATPSGTHSFALKSLGTKTASRLRSMVANDEADDEEMRAHSSQNEGPAFRCDETNHQATVKSKAASSIDSTESTKMIIKKDVAYSIQYGPRTELNHGEIYRKDGPSPQGSIWSTEQYR